ncbi:unnamed protein product [Ceutorhynchus assimilis]|uniref:sphingomyelin phosphodiesterase n=1 Tax=Ceutorhynchus assimilis TaxID=467358 RepID=A0A9N9MQN3_9CUCU|nr:unnamed protein product [Ceutorhynchus assimilis]
MPLQLKIFTLNCWGLALLSKNRKSRFEAIGEWLLANPVDIVCLQEVWLMRDFNFLQETLIDLLPYSHYFYSGVVGSGICILSKHPIEETFFHQWSVNGYIHKLQHADWFGGKGVGLCRLKIVDDKDTYFANVYTTHLHAEYNRASDEYQAHRVLQAYDTAQFILLTSQSADLIVLAGDLNTEPEDLPYRVILTVPGLVDSFVQARDVPQEKMATCDSFRNSYTPPMLLKTQKLGKRIDYVMYHPGTNVTINLKSYDLPMLERVPKKSFSYSDHEGVLVELSISHNSKSGLNQPDEAAKKLVLEECIDLCKDALKSIANAKIFYWFIVVFMCIFIICSLVFPAVYTVPVVTDNPIIFSVCRVLLTGLTFFAFLMATLWSPIEMHGVLSGKVAMEVSLKKITKNS